MNLRHILKNAPVIAGLLALAYELELKADGWLVGNTRGGWNSYYLYKPGDRRQFHVRWHKHDPSVLTLFPMYHHGWKNGTRIEFPDDVTKLVTQMTQPSRKQRHLAKSRVQQISPVMPKRVA